MSIHNILKFSLDSISRKPVKTLAMILLCTFSFVLIATSIIPYKLAHYSHDCVNKALKNGINNTGIIRTTEGKIADGFINLQRDIYQLDDIEAVGGVAIVSMRKEKVYNLYRIQADNLQNEEIEGFECLTADSAAIHSYNLKLDKGELVENNTAESDRIGYVYLGYGFRDEYEINSEIQVNEYYKLVVKGILSEGTTMLTSHIGSDDYSSSDIVNMDYRVIIVNSEEMRSSHMPWLFSVREGANMQHVITQIYELAQKNSVGISIGSLDNLFEQRDSYSGQVNQALLELMIIIIIVAIIVQTCIQVVDISTHFHNYGILYANGANQRDVTLMVIIETIIRFVCAYTIALFAEKILLVKTYTDVNVLAIASEVFSSQITIIILFIGIAMTITSVVVPILIIKKNTPVMLIQKTGK